ncbi:amino acid ABC transporter permease [Abyssibacter profundi]|uniref:Putative glutamine transport system permease protein GlnP n=1 Tax=Abyssibacter profundi TaxID=2182787 RepID=A0A363UPJ9_9GAMM|nr:amino acid ABC transporter permease [Abyssibacter profundi]MBV62698.1 ABC transporter permease [Nevskiales bacterium]PWN57373.1 ABC transporter permease [Abyssibacter profundi]
MKSPWMWHGVYGLVMLALVGAIYGASQTVDYTWRWDRVPDYILAYEDADIRSTITGVVEITDGRVEVIGTQDAAAIERYNDLDSLLVEDGDYIFDGDVVGTRSGWRIGPLAWGLVTTLQLSILALLFALPIGLLAGLGRVSTNPAARNLAATYVELIRGTPLLVQIFIFYFFIGTVLSLSRMTAGVAALAIFTGAYIAEIVRAGIESIPKGQMEAARSLGMSYPQAMRHVILPQALRRTLPPMAGQLINLIKDSSLVSVIAITDLTKAGREVVNSTFSPFEVWFTVAAMYLALTAGLSLLIRRLELKLARADG